MLKTYSIIIKGNDEFYTRDTVKTETFDQAYIEAKRLLSAYSNKTIEQLEIVVIEEEEE